MPFKINISDKGKTFKLEVDTEFLIGKKIGDKFSASELKPELEGYELEITGTSDKAGFPGMKSVEGSGLKKVLLKKGFAMKKSRPKGLRLKKSVRGNVISRDTFQVNTKVVKTGAKKLEEIFPKEAVNGEKNQDSGATQEQKVEEPKPAEEKKEEKPAEEKKEEVKEEKK